MTSARARGGAPLSREAWESSPRMWTATATRASGRASAGTAPEAMARVASARVAARTDAASAAHARDTGKSAWQLRSTAGSGGVGHAGVGAPTSAANADVASAAAASSSASHPRPLCDTAPRVVAVEPSAARTSPTARSSLPKPHCTRRPGPSSGGDMSSARSGVSSRGSSDILRARADRRIETSDDSVG